MWQGDITRVIKIDQLVFTDVREARGGDVQNSGKASIVVWGREIVNNEKPVKYTGCE